MCTACIFISHMLYWRICVQHVLLPTYLLRLLTHLSMVIQRVCFLMVRSVAGHSGGHNRLQSVRLQSVRLQSVRLQSVRPQSVRRSIDFSIPAPMSLMPQPHFKHIRSSCGIIGLHAYHRQQASIIFMPVTTIYCLLSI